MKIALIGSEYSIRRINSLVDLRKIFIDTDEYICKFDEVAPLLERIQDQYDGILFSGVLYFLRAERSVRAKVPWTYPRRSIASVLCALLKAQRAGYDIGKVTYDLEDVPSERYLELLRDYVGLPAEDVRIFRYNDSEFYRRYLRGLINANNYSEDASAFHLDNLSSGRASLCLTGAISVARALPSDRYPTVLVTLTEEDALAAVIVGENHAVRCHRYEEAKEQ